MLSTTARYIYTVYQLKSVSLAAQALFISQPALSRAIKKAEAELGAPIFNRKTLPFSLTAEGKLYIDAIQRILQIEKEAAEKLSDIQHMHGGSLRIGTATHLSFYAIPKILEQFHQQHPQVDIHIIVTDTDKLCEHLNKETADLILISSADIPEGYTAEKILDETLVVAMPQTMVPAALLPYAVSHSALISGTYDKAKAITDTSLFDGLEFIYSPPNSNIQKKRTILFGKSDISPYITSNAGRQQLNYNLMCSGFGALLTTDANIATMPPSAKCMYFVLGVPAAKQDFCIVYPPQRVTGTIESFVQAAKELFLRPMPLRLFAEN